MSDRQPDKENLPMKPMKFRKKPVVIEARQLVGRAIALGHLAADV